MLFFCFALNFDCSFAIKINHGDSPQSLTALIRVIAWLYGQDQTVQILNLVVLVFEEN